MDLPDITQGANKALAILRGSGAVGYTEKNVSTFNGDTSGKATIPADGFSFVKIADEPFDLTTTKSVCYSLVGYDFDGDLWGTCFGYNAESGLIEVIANSYNPDDGSIVDFNFLEIGTPLVMVLPETFEEGGVVFEKGTYVYYGPAYNQGVSVGTLYISKIATETIHPIDPKYLPGVCLPVVEITSVEYPAAGESAELTEEESAQFENAVDLSDFLIVKFSVGDDIVIPVIYVVAVVEIQGVKLVASNTGGKTVVFVPGDDGGNWTMGG